MSQTAARAGRRRAGVAGLATAVVLAGMAGVGASPASANQLVSESFSHGSTTPGMWYAPSPLGTHTPCLTAAATQPPDGSLTWCNAVRDGTGKPDPDGSGVFQITDNSLNDAGALILNQAYSTKAGLKVKFDMYQYNTTTTRGADGISFFLIDGATTNPTVGKSGGWLGYRDLPGAFVGVGFDEYGNFSYNKFWPTGDKGPAAAKPNSVVVRGSQAANYQYLQGVPSPAPLAVDSAKTRSTARRSVTVSISTTNVMSVGIDFNDGKGVRTVIDHVDLDDLPGQGKLPSTIKLGFAASTGSATNYHEISGFSLATLDPDLNVNVTNSGDFKTGGTGSYTINVANNTQAGPTVGRVTETFTVPDGLTPTAASGTGWSCSTSGQVVTCIRPGNGPDALQPGQSYPPIKVDVGISPTAPASVTAQAKVDTMNESNPVDNVSAPDTATVTSSTPDLTPNYSASGPTVTGTVTNKGTGPSDQPATLTFTVPQGATVDKVDPGTGWTCAAPAGGKIVCTHPDPIAAGDTTTPVKVTFGTPDGTALTGTSTATSTTPDDSNTGNDTSPPITVNIPAKGPDLSPTLAANGPTVTGTVSNAKGAGPTTTDVPLEIPIPAGTTVSSIDPGPGWTCTQSATSVKCTRPGTGTNALNGGDTTPPVKVTFGTPDGSAFTGTTTGTSTVPGDTNPGNNTTPPATITIPAIPPNVAVKVDGTGNYVPGGVGQVTATVTNNPKAGPTSGPVTITVPAPNGLTLTSAKGDGWTCQVTDTAATCTRSDPLKAGQAYPPVVIGTLGKPDLTAPVTVTATADAKGDSDTSDNTGSVTLPKNGLQVGMTITPSPYEPGNQLDYTITVTNTGSTDAKGVRLQGDVSKVWGGVPWTCEASDGSACPSDTGAGAIDTTFDVAAGGTVTFKASCELPAGVTQVLTGSATITPAAGSTDPNCAKSCSVTVSDTSANAARRPGRAQRHLEGRIHE